MATVQQIDGTDGSARTLADLLDVDTARARVPEKYWTGLVQSIASGDQLALRELYERSHRIAFTLIMRITGNRETAEEITLDLYHDVWRRASTYDAESGTVVGWILNQARSRAIDRVRFEQRKKRVNPHPEDPAAAAGVSDSYEWIDDGRRDRLLTDALSVLTPNERQAIEYAFFAELTYAEVAARLRVRPTRSASRRGACRGSPHLLVFGLPT